MIQSHCQSDLFHFTYRFFGSLFEYSSTLSIFWSVNPLVLNVSSTYSKYFSGFSLFISADSIVEPCRKMTVLYDKSTNKLSCQSQYTKYKWYYLYFNDSEFGWMFFKIQTWFPFNVTIYINGREYLSKLFDKENIQYTMYNNSFSSVSDFDKAQNIADSILNKHLSDSFDGLASEINIHIKDI